jgi:hypothetical protein
MIVVSAMKGTAVQMVIAVRSERSGDIAFSLGVTERSEKPDSGDLPVSLRLSESGGVGGWWWLSCCLPGVVHWRCSYRQMTYVPVVP